MIGRLAWRNIWRNRRRTLLTMGAISFAAVTCLFTRALQIGTYRATIERVVTINTGHLRIQTPEFTEDGSIESSFEVAAGFLETLRRQEGLSAVSPRLESAGLASAGENTRGVRISALDPDAESAITLLHEKVVEGSWLRSGVDSVAVLGRVLARNLGLGLGDEVVVLTQTWYGTTGAAVYRVGGLLDAGMPDVDSATLYLTLEEGRRLLTAPRRATSLLVAMHDPRRSETMHVELRGILPPDLEALTWRELMPEIVQMIEFDSISGWLFLLLLLLVVGLGILNTVLMGVLERVKQFGVVLAVGMKPLQVARLIAVEGLLMTGIALATGDLIGWALSWYYGVHPITLGGAQGQAMRDLGFSAAMPTYLDLSNFLMVNALVVVITLAAVLFPAVRASRYEPIEALRHA